MTDEFVMIDHTKDREDSTKLHATLLELKNTLVGFSGEQVKLSEQLDSLFNLVHDMHTATQTTLSDLKKQREADKTHIASLTSELNRMQRVLNSNIRVHNPIGFVPSLSILTQPK